MFTCHISNSQLARNFHASYASDQWDVRFTDTQKTIKRLFSCKFQDDQVHSNENMCGIFTIFCAPNPASITAPFKKLVSLKVTKADPLISFLFFSKASSWLRSLSTLSSKLRTCRVVHQIWRSCSGLPT